MKRVTFMLSHYRAEGELIRTNDKTVWIRLHRAGKSVGIKRHIVKHKVNIEEI